MVLTALAGWVALAAAQRVPPASREKTMIDDSKKLGSSARQLLEQSSLGAPPPAAKVGVLVRGVTAFSPHQLDLLRAKGAQVRTVAGDVVTADIAIENLRDLTGFDFVVNIEFSQPLYPDSGTASGGDFSDVE